jgi:NAD+ diphosphatase
MEYNYCPGCGPKLTLRTAGDDGQLPYCDHCACFCFRTFASCVIVRVADQFNEVALVKMPYLSTHYSSLISAYMQPGETAEQAVQSEVQEELGITVGAVQVAGTYWFNNTGVLMYGYITHVHKQPLKLSDELSTTAWLAR